MKTSNRGLSLIVQFEGFRPDAYLVPVGIPTIGFGFIRGVKMGDKMTLAEARDRLKREIVEYEQGVLAACTRQPNQNQFDAFVCFAFNVGVAGFKKSSVLKAHNRGDYQAAARAFGLWVKAGGKTWPGLVRRRSAEASLYLDPIDQEDIEMPQKIEPERSMASSEINRASVVAGSTATLAAVSETVDAINSVKHGVHGLGDWLVPVLLLAVAGLCGYVIWQRLLQRSGGWA